MRATITIAAIGVAAALWRAGTPAPSPLPPPAQAAAASAPAAMPQPAPPAPAMPAAPQSSARMAQMVSVEASVRDARRRGKGEQEVHRLRSASLSAAQVEDLNRMEAAESSWRQRLEALRAACAANIGCDDARASFTREELERATAYAPPALRQ